MDKEELYEKMKDYKPEMTSSERTGAYLSGERVDHIPFAIMSTNRIIANELGYTIRDMDDVDKLSDIVQYKYDHYKMVGLTEELSLRTMGHALGSKLIFPENDIDYIDEFLMEDELNMDLVEIPNPYTNEVLAPKLERAHIQKERFPDMSIETEIPGPITTAAAIRPIEKLLRDLRKQPDKVKELLEFCVQANMAWAKVFKDEFGPTSVMVVDICGHTNKQWKNYKDLDIDFYSVDNCEDLEACKKEIEDKLIVVGNIPPVEVMRYGTIDDVIASVKDCIKKAGDAKSGYIAATGCGSPVGTPIENLDAFIYAINKYGRNAKLGEMPEAINE